MKKILAALIIIFITLSSNTFANRNDKQESEISLSTETGIIEGTLRKPTSYTNTIAIIISGATRTDRNGNQPQTKNNSLKMLAEELVAQNIATLNFDKRGVGKSQRAGANEYKITIDTYVNDVKGWVKLLKTNHSFERIILIGHGEGALIGMLSAIDNPDVSKFISIGGASKKASDTAKAQFANFAEKDKNTIYSYIDKLERGEKIVNVPQAWSLFFRPSLQPYLISLYKHSPIDELSKLHIPSLIVQGNKDVQASVEDADALANANEKANKVVIENMNYVLKECDKEGHYNQLQIYLKPDFPLNKKLVPTIIEFIVQ